MWRIFQVLGYRSDNATLADTRLAGQMHRLPFASFGALPASEQKRQLFVPADQCSQSGFPAGSFKPTLDASFTDHAPCMHLLNNALEVLRAKILILEGRGEQAMSAGRDHDLIRLGQSL